MVARERLVERGRRRGRQLMAQLLADYREARISAGITQAQVGRAIDRSPAWVSWTESGANNAVPILVLGRMLACVGLELSLRAYPIGGGLRDRGQLDALEHFRGLVVPPWAYQSEVGMPIVGDLRAWDCVLTRPGLTIGADVEVRVRDLQAVDRRVMLKLRDSGVTRAIVVVPQTRANRLAIAGAGDALRANYPVGSGAALEALRAGRDPGGNAVIILPARKPAPRADR